MSKPSTIVLVGGSGRSGTTVLNRILNRHSEIFVSPPWRFMIDPDGVLEFVAEAKTSWTPYQADIRYKRLKSLLEKVSYPSLPRTLLEGLKVRQLSRLFGVGLLPRYAHLNAAQICTDFPELTTKFLSAIAEFSYPANWVGTRFGERHQMTYYVHDQNFNAAAKSFYHGVTESCLAASGSSIFVDRNTWNHLFFDKFLAMDKEIKLIHVYRDPRDVVASYINQNWMPRDPVQAARVYQDMMDRWWEIKERVPRDSFIEVALEKIVEDPAGELSKVTAFIGASFEEDLLAEKLNKANTGRWQNDLSLQQQETISQILKPSLDMFGYA